MASCNSSRTPVDTESKLGEDGDPVSDLTLYRSLAGSLQYLTFTRPNISYVVQQICLYMHDPRESHFSTLKRILRYVRGTLDHGLQLFSSSTTYLVAYLDVDLAVCPTTRMLSRLSVEEEYRGVVNVVAETCCEVYLSSNLVQHQRTEHIEIDIHFIRDLVAAGQV
ncbi:ribonuclease H-like domain-containing protein [Tanacetum coccineum]